MAVESFLNKNSLSKHALAVRLSKLRLELDRLTELSAVSYFSLHEQSRLSKAETYYADCLQLLSSQGNQLSLDHTTQKDFFLKLISAQVEIDSILNHEIDPNIGWISDKRFNIENNSDETIIDSQLYTLYFQHSLAGAITEFDFKPRKVNLSAIQQETDTPLSFVEYLATTDQKLEDADFLRSLAASYLTISSFDKASQTIQSSLTRKSPDTLGISQRNKLALPNITSLTIHKNLFFKAGIGAYLNNATTGFSTELWLEATSPLPKNTFLVMQWHFMLPSGNPSLTAARPLLSFGGTAENSLSLKDNCYLHSAQFPGGLYGIRLIDSLENFVLDLRCAKQILGICLIQEKNIVTTENNHYSGITTLFITDAHKHLGDESPQTIFLSIM